MKELTIQIPDDLNSDDLKEYILNQMALELYKTREYSLGYCANLSALSYADFMKYVSDDGNNLFEYSLKEILDDIKKI